MRFPARIAWANSWRWRTGRTRFKAGAHEGASRRWPEWGVRKHPTTLGGVYMPGIFRPIRPRPMEPSPLTLTPLKLQPESSPPLSTPHILPVFAL